jgi:CRP/FNR family transcriptional regulator, cyclic AMP receptor protein
VLARFLKNVPFLSALPKKDLERIYKIAKTREFRPGEPIFTKAEAAEHMFVVLSGRVKIFTHSSGKKRKTFAYLLPGEFFGEMALLEGKTRSASAQAVDPSRILLIGKAEFKRLLISDPDLTYYLLRTVSERLRRANEEIEDLLFRNILGRVSKALFDLGRRHGKAEGPSVTLGDKYTHQELADLVGTTREPLTRALSTLRRANLIDVRDGRYLIKDAAKLGALCLSVS